MSLRESSPPTSDTDLLNSVRFRSYSQVTHERRFLCALAEAEVPLIILDGDELQSHTQ